MEDGAIVGESTPEKPVTTNTFLIWDGGRTVNFELKLDYKLSDQANSGVQYRSAVIGDVGSWAMRGYQADLDAANMFTGQIYEERGRAFLAMRGQFTYVAEGGKPALVSSLGEDAALKSYIKTEDWNEMHIIARGNVLIQMLNGHVMSQLIDDDRAGRKMSGLSIA